MLPRVEYEWSPKILQINAYLNSLIWRGLGWALNCYFVTPTWLEFTSFVIRISKGLSNWAYKCLLTLVYPRSNLSEYAILQIIRKIGKSKLSWKIRKQGTESAVFFNTRDCYLNSLAVRFMPVLNVFYLSQQWANSMTDMSTSLLASPPTNVSPKSWIIIVIGVENFIYLFLGSSIFLTHVCCAPVAVDFHARDWYSVVSF